MTAAAHEWNDHARAGQHLHRLGQHTYSAAGVYNLQVQVNMSQGGNVYAYGPAVVADARRRDAATLPTAWVGQPLGMTLGQSDSPVSVATFTYGVASATASYFAAQIAWGNGMTSTGTVSGRAGQFSVKANHSYAQPGSYTVERR